MYEQKIYRLDRLKQLGYNVKTIWEHDYRKLKQTDEMKLFLDTFDIVTDLEPRDALYGA